MTPAMRMRVLDRQSDRADEEAVPELDARGRDSLGLSEPHGCSDSCYWVYGFR